MTPNEVIDQSQPARKHDCMKRNNLISCKLIGNTNACSRRQDDKQQDDKWNQNKSRRRGHHCNRYRHYCFVCVGGTRNRLKDVPVEESTNHGSRESENARGADEQVATLGTAPHFASGPRGQIE